jgi:hypothetical protein
MSRTPRIAIASIALACLAALTLATALPAQGAKPDKAPDKPAGKPADKPVEAAVPQATTDLIKRAKKVLQAYWNASYEAAAAKQEFKSQEAWETAAKQGEFKDFKDFEAKVAAQRKADAANFPKLYEAARKEIEADYKAKIAKLHEQSK